MKKIYFVLLVFLSQSGFTQNEIHLSFVGDVMGHDTQISGAYFDSIGGYEYSHNYKYIQPIIEQADFAVANLELTLAGPPYKGYPQFASHDTIADALDYAGFDLIITANNHSVDRRDAGIKRTIEVLDKKNIEHTGTFIDSTSRAQTYPYIVDQKGIKIAFLNSTYGTNGLVAKKHIVNYNDTSEIRKDIQSAKNQGADIIIHTIHWGSEYITTASSSQRKLAKWLFQNGVDVIIGSHPHVIQEIEEMEVEIDGKMEKRIIFFSHGNLISNMTKRYKNGGIIGHLKLKKESGKVVVTDYGYSPIFVYRELDGDVRRFYLIPTSVYESDPEYFQISSEMEPLLKEFISDTKTYFENLGVKEYTYDPGIYNKK